MNLSAAAGMSSPASVKAENLSHKFRRIESRISLSMSERLF
jgi:hypothetical protein